MKLGGNNVGVDRTRVKLLIEFLEGDALTWLTHHIISLNRAILDWTFESVIHTLYDRFIHPSSMQDTREGFRSTKYTASIGIQGIYDTLMDYAHNMAVYPDEYTILDVFLRGIPSSIFTELLMTIGLSPEINSLDEFVAYTKEVEQRTKTEAYYRQLRAPRSDMNTTKGQDKTGTKDAPAKPQETTANQPPPEKYKAPFANR